MELFSLTVGGMFVIGAVGFGIAVIYFDARARKKSRAYTKGDYVCCEVYGRIVAPPVLQPSQQEQQYVTIEVVWKDIAGGVHTSDVMIPCRHIKPSRPERRAA